MQKWLGTEEGSYGFQEFGDEVDAAVGSGEFFEFDPEADETEPSAAEGTWESETLGFTPVPVENPGGGRIRDKTPPSPGNLVTILGLGNRRIQLHRLAATAWRAMVNAARAAGIRRPLLLPVSGYRSPETQAVLWRNALRRYGTPQEARRWVAPPGHSAHQSGRAIDLHLGMANSSANVAALRNSRAYRWLAANAGGFGFYPYAAEPWHWEYNPPSGQSPEIEPEDSFEYYENVADEDQGMCSGEIENTEFLRDSSETEGEIGTTQIIDRTQFAYKRNRIKQRDPKTVNALVLHQMAFSRGSVRTKYDKVAAHYAILPDGSILQLHPISAHLYSSNGFNARSVAVEFAGNFPNVRGRCWQGQRYGCHSLTQAQIQAGRFLIGHLVQAINLKYVLAHRQSNGNRENCPGPDIWYNVGQWAVNQLGLSDGGPGYKIGSGNPIPDAWRRPRPRP